MIQKYNQYRHFVWIELNKGYINKNLLVRGEDNEPIAICKYYPDDEIFPPEIRYEREINALELFGGTLAPNIIWKKRPRILVYEYLKGKDLLETQIDVSVQNEIFDSIKKIHDIAKIKRKPHIEDVTKYYQLLIKNYTSSNITYPTTLVKNLEDLIEDQKEILDEFIENITYVHGDLVPPNLIIDNQVKFIDWEFSRPELSFYDYQYFNYYAKAHGLSISLEIDKKFQEFYDKLIDVLERLWRFGFLKKNNNLFYEID